MVDPSESKVFAGMGADAYIFEDEAIALNSHSWGVDPSAYVSDASLGKFYRMTSISYEPETSGR